MSTFQIVYAVVSSMIITAGCVIKELNKEKYLDAHIWAVIVAITWPVVVPFVLALFGCYYLFEFLSKIIAYPFVKGIKYYKDKHP